MYRQVTEQGVKTVMKCWDSQKTKQKQASLSLGAFATGEMHLADIAATFTK